MQQAQSTVMGTDLTYLKFPVIFFTLKVWILLCYLGFDLEEMIRYRWESRVEQAIYNMTGRSLGKSGTQWLTHLEIWLNPAGDVIATNQMG